MGVFEQYLKDKADEAIKNRSNGESFSIAVWEYVMYFLDKIYQNEEAMQNDVNKKKNIRYVAKSAGVSTKFVESVFNAYLARNEVPFGPKARGGARNVRLSDTQRTKIIDMSSGSPQRTTRELAAEFNVSHATVASVLRKAGVKRKPKPPKQQKQQEQQKHSGREQRKQQQQQQFQQFSQFQHQQHTLEQLQQLQQATQATQRAAQAVLQSNQHPPLLVPLMGEPAAKKPRVI